MTLSESDAGLFFQLMLQLLQYANRKIGLIPDCRTIDDFKNLEQDARLRLRDALYANCDLFDQFAAENPAGLNSEELNIVSKWRNFVAGQFFIERYLAKHAIFIKDETVYGVLALHDPFDYLVPKERLPTMVKTVLLSFKGKIVYDGLMSTYSIFFGSGVRGSLREKYLRAKQQGQIVDTLEADSGSAAMSRPKQVRDWRPEIDALFDQAQRLKGGQGTPAVQREIFRLVKASIDLAKSSVHAPNDLDELWMGLRKVHLKMENVRKSLKREE